jgi:RND family efflux transporter MFP subunit
MAIFVLKVALGLVAFAIKPWLGMLFVIAYGVYVWEEMRRPDEAVAAEVELEPLKLRPGVREPSTAWAVFQTVMALVVIFVSSRLFVHQLDAIGPWLGLSPQMVALLLSPVATELPEILNAVIWVRQGKVALALGNISGAMMIQATIPSAFGIFFTPWMLSKPLVWAGVVTMIAVATLFVLLRKNALSPRGLSLMGLFYLLFAAGLLVFPAGASAAERSPRIAVSEKQMKALGIQTQQLQAQAPAAHARFPGQIIVAPGKEQVISSPLAGVVLQLLVQQNQPVKAGAPLIRLAGRELGEQQLQLLQAVSRFELARQAMQRDQQLVDEGILPARRALEAKSAYAEGQAALQQAKAALRLFGMPSAAIERVIASGKPMDSITLTAPRAGMLTSVAVKPGQRVDPSVALLHLAQLDSMWLEVQVPASYAGKWPPGTPVKIAGKSLNARIASAHPLVAAETQMVVLRAAIDGPGASLRPGEMVVVELPATGAPDTGEIWEVPLAAVARNSNQAYVFVRVEDGFEARPVNVQASVGQTVQVQGSLRAGEHVAVSGVVALKGAWQEGRSK